MLATQPKQHVTLTITYTFELDEPTLSEAEAVAYDLYWTWSDEIVEQVATSKQVQINGVKVVEPR